jgi:hypothetical protein
LVWKENKRNRKFEIKKMKRKCEQTWIWVVSISPAHSKPPPLGLVHPLAQSSRPRTLTPLATRAHEVHLTAPWGPLSGWVLTPRHRPCEVGPACHPRPFLIKDYPVRSGESASGNSPPWLPRNDHAPPQYKVVPSCLSFPYLALKPFSSHRHIAPP